MKIQSATRKAVTATDSKWTKHSLTKRLLNHRFKLILLPLLGLPIPVSNDKQLTQVTAVQDKSISNKSGTGIDFVDYRLLPCTTSSLILLMIMVAGDAILSLDRKRIAIHEIGHLIAFKAVQSPTKTVSVVLDTRNGGTSKVNHKLPDNFNSLTDDQGQISLKKNIQGQIIFRAGQSMERLVYGYANNIDTLKDRAVTLVLRMTGGSLCILLNPRKGTDYLRFILQLEKFTQNILKQVDPKIVDKLANRLSEKGYWSSEEVEKIVQEFGFDKLPAFEETSWEIKKAIELLA